MGGGGGREEAGGWSGVDICYGNDTIQHQTKCSIFHSTHLSFHRVLGAQLKAKSVNLAIYILQGHINYIS